ncbi:tRNA lysidine(34) synthetase TilS [Ponticoccus sp. SC2-23]|uniref:tRNA lysidine(34) synthetase TilS n=1 Tax=Alexandriicola marinus TaxID=2081710 RepID=UPI000FD99B81|nr:tRNA lysidine(34) synthetase TilS [Alexandriicola marinus]MBM1221539.1 tRNA lysidine(34) synthetase TilS [Ponticoccus sp. SC6-9]MBM1226580.1 tRNA lysidine(34) synthetase TilS [Ponticoccus sp. SC6-15]MBM1230531.1 tRNA lysidine(34) synthetase TilS [Ponticoccus sp. SC6-38]MBM1235054.1 tRNA lysidine(34) synthetase TilS [Ponticoccus sp. SC6-45]MBM1239552.1 tRNA lysidine(34) synthetase TilS [Ponticoccus sp. SC6-49]MBM1243334.1 tRNA lysidine(34) synthetase TilS [Ponticoccus sp. SC2-64]MBM1248578
MTPEAAFDRALDFFIDGKHGDALGVAVSGGGDSVALMHLACSWCRAHGIRLEVATVDHRLRSEAAEEANAVASAAEALGLRHDTLVWDDWDGRGNLQARAREARRALLHRWSLERGLSLVLLGHTADDQAETFLMRLARGSGVDGLSGIDEVDRDALFIRPLLSVRRADLRDWLMQRGIDWIDDPSNEDTRFDRIKARRALELLEPMGLTPDRLISTAGHMNRARRSLWHAAADYADRHVRVEGGDLIFDADSLWLGRSDTEARVFTAAIRWIGNGAYRPRYDAALQAAEALRRGEARTLGGVSMLPEGGGARLRRELSACPPPMIVPFGTSAALSWEERWIISPPEGVQDLVKTRNFSDTLPESLTLGPLGPAIRDIDDWRAIGLPRESLMTTPALFDQGELVAAPLAGLANGWSARLSPDFRSFLLSGSERMGADPSHRTVSH